MDKTYCDRCGKVCLPMLNIGLVFNCFVKSYDLCYKCKNEFKKFMKQKRG